MNIALLAEFLAPFLPFLTKMAETSAETIAGKFGEGAWNKAKAVWAKLHPAVEAKPSMKEAVTDLATKPDDEDLQAVFRVQLKKLLEQDQQLAKAITQIFQDDTFNIPSTQIAQTVTGNQNQVIGQVSGGQVISYFGRAVSSPITASTTNAEAATNLTAQSAIKQSVKTILFLTANPHGTMPLRLSEEVRDIQRGLERSQHRERFTLEQRSAVTPTDVRRALLDRRPQIVHFSGHGLGYEMPPSNLDAPEGLALEDEAGNTHLVSSDAIASLFSLFKTQIECVVLNACYSVVQAQAIVQHIPFVIGMRREIGDQAAIEFSIGFYDALLAGEPVPVAYQFGCNAIQMAGIPEYLTPVLHTK